MNSFVLVAKIEAKPAHRETIKNALLGIVEPTLNETGCLLYELHEDRNNKNLFIFYEIWETRSLWEDHNVSTHILKHKQDTEGMMASFELFELQKIAK